LSAQLSRLVKNESRPGLCRSIITHFFLVVSAPYPLYAIVSYPSKQFYSVDYRLASPLVVIRVEKPSGLIRYDFNVSEL